MLPRGYFGTRDRSPARCRCGLRSRCARTGEEILRDRTRGALTLFAEGVLAAVEEELVGDLDLDAAAEAFHVDAVHPLQLLFVLLETLREIVDARRRLLVGGEFFAQLAEFRFERLGASEERRSRR
jgi:hypothetical protein